MLTPPLDKKKGRVVGLPGLVNGRRRGKGEGGGIEKWKDRDP